MADLLDELKIKVVDVLNLQDSRSGGHRSGRATGGWTTRYRFHRRPRNGDHDGKGLRPHHRQQGSGRSGVCIASHHGGLYPPSNPRGWRLNPMGIFITGRGILTVLGKNTAETYETLATGCSRLGPLTRFTAAHSLPLPVGEIAGLPSDGDTPETHRLARLAADQAMAGCTEAPDAVILGVTTGGLSTTEALLKEGCNDPERYRHHAIGSVAEDLARRYHCKGPVITVSTACSSGACAIALSLAMLRGGAFQKDSDRRCRLALPADLLRLQVPSTDRSRRGPAPCPMTAGGCPWPKARACSCLEASPTMRNGIETSRGRAFLRCPPSHPAPPRGGRRCVRHASALEDAGLPRMISITSIYTAPAPRTTTGPRPWP